MRAVHGVASWGDPEPETEAEFVREYVLTRASAITGGVDVVNLVSDARYVWAELQKIKETENENE